MKANKIIVLMLALVLVCAILVACNDKAADEYVGVIKGDASRGWKPTADPDPNNPLDVDSEQRDYSEPQYEFYYTKMYITYTNSESLNNLFYDYTIADFDSEKFVDVREEYPDSLQNMRDLASDVGYGIGDKKINYLRTLVLTLKEPSRENVLKYINEFKEDKGILWADPDLKGGGIGWSATTTKD